MDTYRLVPAKCVVIADGRSLGSASCTSTARNAYLKTVYACVNQSVMKDQYQFDHKDLEQTTARSEVTSADERSITNVEETMMSDLSAANDDKDQQESSNATPTEKDTDMVVGLVSDVMTSYGHIRRHKAKLILLATLSVALGLTLFLGLLIWGVYRSSRLSRIKSEVQRHSGYFGSGSMSNGGLCSPGAPKSICDLDDVEVGDLEDDSDFRDQAPDPLILAPPPPEHLLLDDHDHSPYGKTSTIRRSISARDSFTRDNPGGHEWLLLNANGNLNNGNLNMPDCQCDLNQYHFTHLNHHPGSECSNTSSGNNKVVRYSTIGRPRVASPGHRIHDNHVDVDLADPKSLTLSRTSNQDHLLYG